MNELFKRIFKDKGVDDKQIEGYQAQFSLIVLLSLAEATSSKFSDEEKNHMQVYLTEDKYSEALHLVESKYSPEEWAELLKQTINPLVDDYMTNVVNKA